MNDSAALGSNRFVDILKAFGLLGLTSFGGPIAHIGFFYAEFVVRRRWLTDAEFAHLLAICQFLPGPASSQLGFSIGLMRGGWLGGLAAFIGFTLPSAAALVLFACGLPLILNDWTSAGLHGLKIVAFVVVADGVRGMANKLCPDGPRQTIAITAAALLLLTGALYVQLLLVILGAIFGIWFCCEKPQAVGNSEFVVRPTAGRLSLCLFVLLLLGLPLLAWFDVPVFNVARVFYQAGSLVFGGGHVVLPWLEASVVDTGIVSRDAFLSGYGLAQAIPGPLFTFAAYIGALWPAGLPAVLIALLAIVFIFLPGFLLVIGILPFWQQVAQKPAAVNAIAGINAVVVGLLGAALFQPIFTSAIMTGVDMAVALVAFWIVAIRKQSVLYVVGWCVFASVVRHAVI